MRAFLCHKNNNMTEQDYDEGRRDGRIEALEKMQANHNRRLEDHSRRIMAQERIVWALVGAIALIELIPAIKSLL